MNETIRALVFGTLFSYLRSGKGNQTALGLTNRAIAAHIRTNPELNDPANVFRILNQARSALVATRIGGEMENAADPTAVQRRLPVDARILSHQSQYRYDVLVQPSVDGQLSRPFPLPVFSDELLSPSQVRERAIGAIASTNPPRSPLPAGVLDNPNVQFDYTIISAGRRTGS